MQYFKVVGIPSDTTIDTREINYSLTLEHQEYYYLFLDFITTSSDNLDLPLDFYISLNNNLALYGEDYQLNFPKAKNGIYSIIDITRNLNHAEYQISAKQVVEIIKKLIFFNVDFFAEGNYLWEFILEKVRAGRFVDLPARAQSFFLFENVTDCDHYKKIIGGGCICKIDLIKIDKIFKGDMNIIDLVPNHYTYQQAAIAFENYWSAKSSDNPVYEILVQGICKMTS